MAKRDIKQSLALGEPLDNATKSAKNLNAELGKTESFGNRLAKTFKNLASSISGAKTPGSTDTRIASLPEKNAFFASVAAKNIAQTDTSATTTDGNKPKTGSPIEGDTGASGGSAFTRYVNNITGGGGGAGAVGAGLFGLGSGALNSAQQYIYQQLGTSRLGFYGLGGGAPGGSQEAYGNITDLFNQLNKMGIITDQQDTLRAMLIARQGGMLGGGQGQAVNVLKGFETASAITPGMGPQGAAQAFTGVYSGTTTNQLLTAGIRTRNADGTLRPITDIADEIWAMMNRVKTKQGDITPADLNTLLTPGFTLARFLDAYFGPDTPARQSIVDMLYVKAQTKVGKLSNITTKELSNIGALTPVVVSGSKRTAAGASVLAATAPSAVKGIEFGNQVATALSNLALAAQNASGLVGAFAGVSQGVQTVGGTGNGLVGKLLSGIPFIGGFFRASGGPVDDQVPYIVGEKGPELFVPKTDGVIVPNHIATKGLNRDSGGGVKGGGAAKELHDYLVSQGISDKAAVGIIGNLAVESGLRTTAVGDGGTSYGIAQWHNERWQNLNKFAASKGLDPSSMSAQQQFLVHELKKYPSLWEGLTSKKISEADAAARFMREFERPRDKSDAAAQKRADAGVRAMLGKYDYSKVTPSGVAPTATATSTSTTDRPKIVGPVAGDFASSNGGIIYNLGGVTINVTGKADAKQIGSEVKKAIQSLNQDKALGNK